MSKNVLLSSEEQEDNKLRNNFRVNRLIEEKSTEESMFKDQFNP